MRREWLLPMLETGTLGVPGSFDSKKGGEGNGANYERTSTHGLTHTTPELAFTRLVPNVGCERPEQFASKNNHRSGKYKEPG